MMGYYTRYKLEYDVTDPRIIQEELVKTVGYDPLDDECKWYEHEIDMKKLSEKFSKTLFILSGEGEESEDIWTKYFLNGKSQICKAEIIVPPFDKSKLK